jgi:hypothetical protein
LVIFERLVQSSSSVRAAKPERFGEQRRGHVLFFVDVTFRRRRGEREGKLVGRFMFRTVE